MKKLSDLQDQPIASHYFALFSGEKGRQRPLHHFMIFYGPRGVGKMTAAHLFIQSFFCEKKTGCGNCAGCGLVLRGNHPDLIIFPEKHTMIGETNNPEAYTIRWLKKKNLQYHSYYSGIRFILFPNGMLLQNEAEGALLKILEEPPPNTYFLMVLHQRQTIRNTILSRAFQVPFFALRDETLRSFTNLTDEKDIELLGGNLFWTRLVQSEFSSVARKKITSAWHHLQDMLELENWLGKELEIFGKNKHALNSAPENTDLGLQKSSDEQASAASTSATEYSAIDLLDFFTMLLLQSCKYELPKLSPNFHKKSQHIFKSVFSSREHLHRLGRKDSGVLIPYINGQLFARLRALWQKESSFS